MVMPVTNEMMRAFSLKRSGDNLIFPTRRAKANFDRAIMDMFDAEYLQVRDVLAAEATRSMLEAFSDKIENVIEDRLFKEAQKTVDVRKQLPAGDNLRESTEQ